MSSIPLEKFLNEGKIVKIENISDYDGVKLRATHWYYPHNISSIGLGLEEEIKEFLSKNKNKPYDAWDFQTEFNKEQKIKGRNHIIDYQTLENHLLYLVWKEEIEMRILDSPQGVPNTEYFATKMFGYK